MAISGLAGDVIVNGHSANTIRINYQGGMSQTIKDISSYMEKYERTSDVNNQNEGDFEIRENKVNLADLTGGQLGFTKFKLESLFDPTHGSTQPTRESFGQDGKIESDLLLHTPKGIGSTKNLNIRSTKGYGGRFGNLPLFKGNEPYIVKPIGAVGRNEKASGYDRDWIHAKEFPLGF